MIIYKFEYEPKLNFSSTVDKKPHMLGAVEMGYHFQVYFFLLVDVVSNSTISCLYCILNLNLGITLSNHWKHAVKIQRGNPEKK